MLFLEFQTLTFNLKKSGEHPSVPRPSFSDTDPRSSTYITKLGKSDLQALKSRSNVDISTHKKASALVSRLCQER